MSTYWHYECLSHPGGLISADEFTQHSDDRYYDQGVALIAQRPVERDDRYWSLLAGTSDEDRTDLYFSMQARAFLSEHPTCVIGIIDEYGERGPLPAQTTPAVEGPAMTDDRYRRRRWKHEREKPEIVRTAEQFVGADELNRLAIHLMLTWGDVDPDSAVSKYPASYVANFADMARAILDAGDKQLALFGLRRATGS